MLGWRPLSAPGPWALDRVLLLAGLRDAAAQGATGWLAGSGFEACPDLLDAGQSVLPLLGTPAAVQRRLCDPRQRFAQLAALGIPHPQVAHALTSDLHGWLLKDGHGCGGGHVRGARPGQVLSPSQYLQRTAAGQPMSATFVADGRCAVLLGINQQLLAPLADQPYRFGGVVGPVTMPDAVQQAVHHALERLVPAFGVCGLGSLDFMAEGERIAVLEVNARPSASLALYPAWAPVTAHVAACLGQGLGGLQMAATQAADRWVRGWALVHAPHPRPVGAALAQGLSALADAHDLPHTGDALVAGGPVCSVSACAADATAVRQQLAQRQARVHHLLESTPP